MKSPYRDDFRITGYRFGSGKKSLALVGAMRGDEIQQQYVCAQVIKRLKKLEEQGKIAPDHEILVIPSANPFSMNIGSRFWAMDNTDINRMFPGYDQGETTQRIAAGLFDALQGYEYGIQMPSFYIAGDFVPHIRVLQTGYEDLEGACRFGLPYVCIRIPKPFDTTLLNYNWQIWETKAFSLYGGQNNRIEGRLVSEVVRSILRFMSKSGMLEVKGETLADFNSQIFMERDLLKIKCTEAGFLYRVKRAGEQVFEGETLAYIIDSFDGERIEELKSPCDGIIFYAYNRPLALQNTNIFSVHSIED